MLKVYVVRHGQTLFNILNRAQGWSDSPLTESGILQARACGIGLREVPFEACYVSTSERAVDTAHCVLEGRDVPYVYTKNLREYFFGTYEGHVFNGTEKVSMDDEGFVPFGGENYDMLRERIFKVLDEVKEKYKDGNVLFVSHNATIMTLFSTFNPELKKEWETKRIGNCSVGVLGYDNGWKILDYNNVSYRDKGLEVLK